MSLVAIVGRPNVGKSTLFNRLVGERKAIVDATAGTTRDRHYGKTDWNGKEFSIIDTGGYTVNSEDIFEDEIRRQVLLAIDEADVILFLVEVRTGITDLDMLMADILRRTSKKVQMIRSFPDHDVKVKLNASLFEWVIENLCKNAVDAMEGAGTITLSINDSNDKEVVVEVTDTGKGIKKKDMRNVFRPGFTTKKRGWGLGLSLAKRIVEEYHHGRIYVKSSELGKGTTFRIELKR